MNKPAAQRAVRSLPPLVAAMRPSQWTKNLVVLAAFFFAFWDRCRATPLGIRDLATAVAGAALFCAVSSAVYLVNDIRDLAADRRHPVKRFRPIAAGRVAVPHAAALAVVLLCVGIVPAGFLSPRFALVLGGYVALQLAYNLWLRTVPLVDILLIATGFVLRAIAGAVVLNDVTISPWLLLCTFLLALFLALCKRRHEKLLSPESDNSSRASLHGYDAALLDQLIAITSSAVIVCYAIYTLWPQTVEKFGTSGLGFTIPFVIFGIFRYLDLAYRCEKGDRPEKILLTDLPLMVDVLLYCITAVVVFQVCP